MSAPSQTVEADVAPPIMVRVTAPSALEEGYEFDAIYNGEVFPVTVPRGGVKAGQSFSVPFVPRAEAYAIPFEPIMPPDFQQQEQQQQVFYPSSETTPMLVPQSLSEQNRQSHHHHHHHHHYETTTVPLGTWKTHLCDCLSEGWCHPSLCSAIWSPQILMGQVLTRMKLDCCGNRTGLFKTNATFVWILLTVAFWCVRIRYKDCSVESPWESAIEEFLDDDDLDAEWETLRQNVQDTAQKYTVEVPLQPPFEAQQKQISSPGPVVPANKSGCTDDNMEFIQTITWVWFWVTIGVLARLRRAVRKAHGISRKCGPCEDLCCSFTCMCCLVAQLARQTADYGTDRAYCFTATGLADARWLAGREATERRHTHGHHLVHAHSSTSCGRDSRQQVV